MNQLAAMQDTLALAASREYNNTKFEQLDVDYTHLVSMYERASTGEFSEGKLGRWLGYMQGVLIANGCITLDEAKALNKKHAD